MNVAQTESDTMNILAAQFVQSASAQNLLNLTSIDVVRHRRICVSVEVRVW